MTTTKKGKAKGAPKKEKAAKANTKTAKGKAKSAAQVEHLSTMTGVPKNVIYTTILKVEDYNLQIKAINDAKKEVMDVAKTQGLSKTSLNEAIRYRKLEQDVLVNRIEDLRIIFEACEDMNQLDLFGTRAIQKYVDEQKEKGNAIDVKGNIGAVKAASPNPEDAAQSLIGDNSIPKIDLAAAAQPRRVGELLN